MHPILVKVLIGGIGGLWLVGILGCTHNPPIESMLARVSVSVVAVGQNGATRGSAWCIGPNLFVTNAHVVQHPDGTRGGYLLSAAGNPVAYRIRQVAKVQDLALLAANLDVPALPLAATAPKVGQSIFALGNPLGLGLTATGGIISAEARSIGKGHLLQIDAAVNPGNSGGPLVDSDGRVVGVVSERGAVGSGIGFAIPNASIAALLQTESNLESRP